MNIKELTARFPMDWTLAGAADTEITSLCIDSRQATSGCLFFCITGLHSDGHAYAQDVKNKGAAALVVERKLNIDLPQIQVADVRKALSYLAAAFYGYPADKLKIIGITGTKGKTTTSFMLRNVLLSAGKRVGLIGTVCTLIGEREIESGKTTPDPIEFQRLLREMVDAGMEYVVMEVSAHALDMHRVAGVRFLTAGFTNLSQDHLDYFFTMENYLQAKLAIADMTGSFTVNVDDAVVTKAVREKEISFRGIGIREKADVYAKDIEITHQGMDFTLILHRKAAMRICLKMSGLFNVYNAIMAAALADNAGIAPENIKDGLDSLHNVPGRVELLDTHTPYRVILDYAHSPDALENVLSTLRQSTSKRLIAVFGCGGGRDKLKRPIMGEIGGRLADYSVVTSDNPRNEDPMQIIREIEEGIKDSVHPYTIIENRREAIKHALRIAESGDTVVLAGKGHETYQEIMGVKHPFDEKIVVREVLEELLEEI